ncbi:cyclin-T isoform X1 [Glossina fuscipes]|uniref:Cyclin-T isoform X1 n=1 Tax=Glossina fuscipes TaxID=7396 RepID=A0A9C6E4I3_9MUSC|nr:cyclin-T isoform X1 [Glossina fuscipes]XP_037901024.1 cyclin-T isoform X1 [Glossina fuscipes]KAI9587221.1 hypothetical protein GQX74_003068 [Glossina fuscipes]
MSGVPSPLSRCSGEKDKDSMWYFTSEQLANSPSRQQGISADQELSYRQMTAYLIQEMGQRLQVSQLCINTAIVYMHRFYAFHSFTHFHRNGIAAASLFLAAKVEEQPRKLEHVIKAANKCLNQPISSTTDNNYMEQATDLVFNENVLLQTLGFDVAIDHPHTHVVKTCQLVKACKDLAQTSYFLASNSLHLTSMCLQYKPTVVACFCIYLACRWSRWEIPQSTEGKHWFHYVDETVTMDLLKQLTEEFIAIYEKSPARLKSKLNSIKALAQGCNRNQGQVKDKKPDQDWKVADVMKMYQPADSVPVSGNSGQTQSSSYTAAGQGPMSNDQPQPTGQSVPPPMLPPPSHQSQQIRKSDMHSSSQHRSHHTSSTSSSHHPSKIGFASADVQDHKVSSHKQQPQQSFGSNINRPREHSGAHPQALMTSSKSSNNRSSLSGNLAGQNFSRPQSQGHLLDGNFHKSRDRNLSSVPAPVGINMPAHAMSHKVSQKQDPNRSLAKESAARLPTESQSLKTSGAHSNSNKIFSSSSSLQYGGSNSQQQMPPSNTSNSQTGGTKMDVLHDMSRNIMHNSRNYNNVPTNGPTPPSSFHQQQQQMSRHSTNGNNSNSIKHEQSKQMSVHMQQQTNTSTHHQHHHHHHKQILPLETAYAGSSGSHDLTQQSQSHSFTNMRPIESLQHSDDHANTQFNAHLTTTGGITQSQNVAKAANSMFSPDWIEKAHVQQHLQSQSHSTLGSNYNGIMNAHSAPDNYIYKMPQSTSTTTSKESPTKVKSERDSSKKDKNRNTDSSLINRSSIPHTLLKTSLNKKVESSLMHSNELAGTSCNNNNSSGGIVGIKRSNEQLIFKHEDDISARDNKIRRLDNINDINKHQVVNGIETNPDMVRNLLKESLCTTSGLLKTETITPSLQPPTELLEPSATTSAATSSILSTTGGNTNTLPSVSGISAMEVDDHTASGSKSEKKKKKDKHKHKEKDKSKDREERKKHKKDKDRHKEKDRSDTADNTEHVKIKISKEKLEHVSGEPIGLKIKIPKDIIQGDLNTNSNAATSNADMQSNHAPPVLKIKISKDKLESYSSGSSMDTGSQPTAHHYGHSKSLTSNYAAYSNSHANVSTNMHNSSGNNSGTSKKRDRDRDRERDKERDKDKKRHTNHDSSSKTSGNNVALMASLNGAGSTATNGPITGSHGGTTSSQKGQYSSKIYHHNHMSQLFGESNDDDDDDDIY